MNQYFKQTLTKSDIFTQPTELDETLKGLPRGEVGVLVAPGATGKSFFVLNMLLASCNAVVKNHLIVKPIRILYLSLEDRLDDIQRRLHAYMMGNLIMQSDIEKNENNFEIIAYKGSERLISKNIPQKENKLWQSLKERINSSKPDLVILDTLIKCYEGYEENSNPDMAKVLSFFNELAMEHNCSILLLHHTNKAAINSENASSQTNSRGASAIVDNSRWVISLKKQDDINVVCEAIKMNFTSIKPTTYSRLYKGILFLEEA